MPDLKKLDQTDFAFVDISKLHLKPKNPLNSRIENGNCCLRALYNIPQGTMMLLLPGALIFMMGIIVLPWTIVEEGWSDGTQQAGIIFVGFGGFLFFGGIAYGCYFYFKYKPKTPSKQAVQPFPKNTDVHLVGMYKIRQDGMSVPMETPQSITSITTATIS